MSRAGVFSISLLLAAGAARAQVRVTVVDPSGARVPQAIVELRADSGVTLDRATASYEGVARFPGPGSAVSVRARGFRAALVELAGQARIVVELEFEVGSFSVDVASQMPQIPAVAAEQVSLPEMPRSDLVDSLRESPGVQVLRRGAKNFEPVVQGLRETQVAMVVDDTRTFAAGPARMDSELSHVDPGNVASVSVVTGPYALTEGAGAMASIVVRSDPIPRQPDWRFGGRGGIGWLSNGSGRVGQARLDAGNSIFGLRLNASGSLQDDYRAGGPRGGRPVPSSGAGHQFGIALRFNPAESHELSGNAFYDEQTGVDYPGRLLTAEHFILRSWSGGYRLDRPGRLLSGVKFTGYLNKKSHRMSNRGKPTAKDMPGRMPPFALDVSLPTEADTAGMAGRLLFAPANSDWRVTAGFDHFDLTQDAQRFISRARDRRLLFSDSVWAGTSQRNTGLYLQADRDIKRGGVWAAVRLDSERSDAGRPSEFYRQNVGGGSLRASRSSPSFSVAARRDLAAGLTLAGGFGRVARMPNALERYSDRFPSTRFQVAAEFMGDPGIRPETSIQGDVSLQWKVGRLRLDASGFVRSLADYITVMPDARLPRRLPLSPPVVFRYVNGDGASFRGWNLGARWIADRVELKVSASKVLADDRELKEPVLGIAPMEVSASTRFVPAGRRFWAEFGARHVWDQRRVAATRFENRSPPFSLFSARVGATLGQGALAYFGATNLGNVRYAEHMNSLNPFTGGRVPEMGRALTAGLALTW